MSKFAGLALAVEQPSRMIILHPISRQPLRNAETGEETWIDILSTSSVTARAHDRAYTDSRIRMGNRRMTAEDIDIALTERISVLTKGWSLCALDGTTLEVECNPANARELYSMPELAWLREQAIEHADNLGNFRKGASQS